MCSSRNYPYSPTPSPTEGIGTSWRGGQGGVCKNKTLKKCMNVKLHVFGGGMDNFWNYTM